jgi:GntR family transcriptional regulator
MAVSTEVNPNTVMRTFNYLQEKGIIYNKRGIGYFVADDGFEKTRTLRKENFVNLELPNIFMQMRLLRVSMDDVNNYYQEYLKR